MRMILIAVAALVAAPALAQDAGPSGRLMLYTSQPNADAQQTIDAFMAAYPNVEVEFFREGTTRVMAKLESEFAAGDPQPDVLFIADTVTMEQLKNQGRLMPHPEADVSAYDPALYDEDKTYFSTKLITTGIVYNTAAPMVPTSYKDLLAAEAKDNIVIPSPMTSGAAAITMAAITEHPDLGWDYYEALAAQGTLAQGGNGGVYRAVAGGEKLYGFLVDFLAIRNMEEGAPVGFTFPEEGVTYVTEPVAILSTARNPEAAKAFVDFILSREGQELAVSQGYLPAHPDVAPPAGFPPRSEIRLMSVDPAVALEEDAENKMRFQELFGG